jgi:uncharacterized protein
MFKVEQSLRLSATDLVGHLDCRHLTHLDWQVAHGLLERPRFRDRYLEVLWERGALHERSYVEHLAATGAEVIRIGGVGVTPQFVAQTQAAMHAGAQIIVQAALLHAPWSGRADILRRVAVPSRLGAWSYEVIDTKLARTTRAGTLLQLCLYADLLAQVQGSWPEHVHVVTPGSGFEPQRFRTAAYAAYYRHVKHSLERALHEPSATTYPDPNQHCEICHWRRPCEAKRKLDDHLCLVAGITKLQTAQLQRHGIATLEALAGMPIPLQWKPERGVRQSYERVREQARVQCAARTSRTPLYETIAAEPGCGLARLPEPSAGDVFFDIEGDPFVGESGLEYLFGHACVEAGQPQYVGEWALTRAQERGVFERFVDFIMARWAQYPQLHIYHYAPYEPGALKRLMGRFATREAEVDRMLRAGLFVDLHAVVRQGIRASLESYTLKNLEQFCGYTRAIALEEARPAIASLEAALELGRAGEIDPAARATVEGYNRDDCLSALSLRDWLESVRQQLIGQGAKIERPQARSAEAAEDVNEQQRQVAELVARLTHAVPSDAAERTAEQHARWILAHTLDWHRREFKPVVWEKFRLAELTEEELFEDRAGIAGLELLATVGGTQKAPVCRYAFPPQDLDLRTESALYVAGGVEQLGDLEAFSLRERTLDVKKRSRLAAVNPDAVFGVSIIGPGVLPAALLGLGEHFAQTGFEAEGEYRAARDLLLRQAPQIEPLRRPDETAFAAAVRLAPHLPPGVFPIQGPPGAGKTHTAAHMICALIRAGKRVGVTANSHKVIRNVLDKVVAVAEQLDVELACIQKVDEIEAGDSLRLRFTKKNPELFRALATTCPVAGGTAWLWAREEARASVDVLFVDEAAQMSLANVLAVSQACRTLVLVGDPQQLDQPTRGSHPEDTDVSALHHLLDGKPTIAAHQGLFLDETWRLHPQICSFTSELFYEGKLRPRAGLEHQVIASRSRVHGTGLRFLPVVHAGNQSSAPEEAERIRELVQEILGSSSIWTDHDGQQHSLRAQDILIIAPYNAQVFELQERLPGSPIGTVDKFQGQEAPIVIYSMTTSTHADAPRGMEFLYSLNRLNVATSRAKCLCILVGAPALFEPECRTPRHMELANAFCRYLEKAELL